MSPRPCSLVLLLCVLLTGVVVLQIPESAHARGQDDPAALREARQRFQEGVRFFDARKYKKARAAFLQAYALKEHPTVLLNLAQSELRAGYEADAARHFAQFLRETDGSGPAQVKQAQEGLAKAKKKVGEVVLAVDVDDAFILVDGVLHGRSPLPDPLYLTPGTHVVGVRKGGKSLTRQVTAIPGESTTEMVNVTGPHPEAGAAPGGSGPGEASDEDAAADEYSGVGREPFVHWLKRNPIGLVGAGVAVLGLGTATVFTVTWQTNESKAEDTRANILEAAEMDGIDGPCSSRPTPAYERACSDYLAFRDTAENHRNIALVVGALAVAAIGGTVAAYFVTSKQGTGYGRRPAPPRVSVLPELTPDRQGLQVVGHF